MRSMLLALAAATTFASAAWAQEPATAPEPKAEAAAPAEAKGGLLPPPPAGKGQIVFYRPGRFVGAAVGYKLSEDGKALGKVSNGRYLVVTAEPGLHTYVMDFGTKGDLRLEVEPDETYYIECGIAMGAILNHPDLIPSKYEDFERFASKGKPQKVKEAADKDAADKD